MLSPIFSLFSLAIRGLLKSFRRRLATRKQRPFAYLKITPRENEGLEWMCAVLHYVAAGIMEFASFATT